MLSPLSRYGGMGTPNSRQAAGAEMFEEVLRLLASLAVLVQKYKHWFRSRSLMQRYSVTTSSPLKDIHIYIYVYICILYILLNAGGTLDAA